MTVRDVAPTVFVALFVLAGIAILGEITIVVRHYLTTGRDSEPSEGAPATARIQGVLRIVAPVCLLGAGAILAWLSLTPVPGSADAAGEAAPGPATGGATPSVQVGVDETGIGAATAGMTLGDLRAALGAAASIGAPNERFMVDITALPVIEGTDTLYHVLFPVGAPVDENTRLELVATTHPLARTAAGVGPGTTLEAAAEQYGPPTLSYSVHDESREYARFPGQPGDGIRFRVAPASGLSSLAGSYATTAEYNETEAFDPEARIFMVMVRLRAASTSGAEPPR